MEHCFIRLVQPCYSVFFVHDLLQHYFVVVLKLKQDTVTSILLTFIYHHIFIDNPANMVNLKSKHVRKDHQLSTLSMSIGVQSPFHYLHQCTVINITHPMWTDYSHSTFHYPCMFSHTPVFTYKFCNFHKDADTQLSVKYFANRIYDTGLVLAS